MHFSRNIQDRQIRTFRLWKELEINTSLITQNNNLELNKTSRNSCTCGLVDLVKITRWVWLVL